MAIQVLYFSILRAKTGLARESLDVEAPISVRQLRQIVLERHPELARVLTSAVAAVNRDFASEETLVRDGDEVALFPPVAGGGEGPPTIFRITTDPLDLNALLAEVTLPSTGAACVFTGLVRARTERGGERITTALDYEAYQPMAEAKMRQLATEIRRRWPSVEGIAIVQRIGHLEPGTPAVIVACTAAHRDTGVFEAARYGIDRLKQIVPVWKKEIGPEGETWVEGDYRPGEGDRNP